MIKGEDPIATPAEPDHGRKGKNGNWPGCTEVFVKRTEKRRKRNKLAKKSRKANRK